MSKTQQTSQSVDPLQRSAVDAVWAKAQEVANKPYEAYGGQLVAGPNKYQTAGWDMAAQGAYDNVGGQTLNQALAAIQNAAQYRPMQVSGPSVGSTGYGGATIDPITQAMVERLGNATQANAATVDRSGVQDVMSEQGLKYLQSYLNPYEDQVVQNSLNDLDRSRQMAIVGGEDGALRAGGYSGSRHGVADSLTNEASLRQAANTAGQLRMAGFNTAANLGMTDAQRALQAAMANQGADLTAMTSNAGFQQQANLTNAAAQNQYGLANANFGNQANQFNAGAANSRAQAQAQLANQAGIASMQAANQAAQMQAQMAMQASLANQQAQYQAANLGLSAGGALAGLSDQQRSQYFQNAAALESAGGAYQTQDQRELDSAYQQWLRAQNYPNQQLQALTAGAPSGLGMTVTQSPSQAASWGQGLSSLGGLLSLFGGGN